MRLARTVVAGAVLAAGLVAAIKVSGDDMVAAAESAPAAVSTPAASSPPTGPDNATGPDDATGPTTRAATPEAPITPWVAPTQIPLEAPVPGTTNLQPLMISAYDRAAAAAEADGVTLPIRSGWRSPQFQQVLFERAVRRYGSAERATALVKPPEQSMHVQGLAVDLRDRAGARWLEQHGQEFGLCRRYENEWWHFEFTQGPCPALLADASG